MPPAGQMDRMGMVGWWWVGGDLQFTQTVPLPTLYLLYSVWTINLFPVSSILFPILSVGVELPELLLCSNLLTQH